MHDDFRRFWEELNQRDIYDIARHYKNMETSQQNPIYFGGPRCGERFGNPSWILPPDSIRLPPHNGTYLLKKAENRYVWIQDLSD